MKGASEAEIAEATENWFAYLQVPHCDVAGGGARLARERLVR